MKVIGITGSIGMGKSTAADMLRDMGVPVHDSDAAVHRLLAAGGAAVVAVGKVFPEAVKADSAGQRYIDRAILGQTVFFDRHKKKTLEDILHTLVQAESDQFIALMQENGHDLAALDIPLLFETGAEKRVDMTLCVSAPPEVQRMRVMERHGMTSEKFDQIVAGQLPDAEKRRRAGYVLDSGQDLDGMRRELSEIIAAMRAEKPAL